jgi:stage II sporulation protein AA (anti-sigma F factor antagonist)
MKLTKKNIDGFCVIGIEGRIDTTNFNEFEKEIAGTIEAGETKLVLNCSAMNYISSSGLRVFLIAQKKLTAVTGKLHLCEMQPTIREIFDISGFSTIFKIFDTEESALKG